MAEDINISDDSKRLVEFCNRIINLADSLTNIKIHHEDNIGFIGMCFLSKQIDHLKAIVKLTPSKDTQLIARSMIEGMCQLFWADKDEMRAIRWRAFASINDWRSMEKSIRKGQAIPENQRIEVNSRLEQYENIFIKPKYKELKSEGKTIPRDPYHYNWRCRISIKSICKDVGASDLYDQLYGSYSDWHHWGVGSLGLMLEKSEQRISYQRRSSDSESSLAVGFQCLIQTLQFLDNHFELGLNEKAEKIETDYINWNVVKST